MKSLAVLSPSLAKKVAEEDKCEFKIDSYLIPLALIDVKDTEFDSSSNDFSNLVLVKKKGFSLNYRDIGIIENAWQKLSSVSGDSFYPIGSDFCGEVVEIGKNVNTLAVGDLVIPDCSYPISNYNSVPGIPSNHASKELEVFHHGKLKKIPENFDHIQASGMSIGTQTAVSMIRKADIQPGQNILVTSVTSNTSFFILNFLRDLDCNIYGISYTGNNIENVKSHFPFIKEIYSFNEKTIPQTLLFDIVFDPFADTYIEYLLNHCNFNSKYITCGFYNQSSQKIQSTDVYKNLPILLSTILFRNISLIGNCLGDSNDLSNGIQTLNACLDNKIKVDKIYNSRHKIRDFIQASFSHNHIGKVIFEY